MLSAVLPTSKSVAETKHTFRLVSDPKARIASLSIFLVEPVLPISKASILEIKLSESLD